MSGTKIAPGAVVCGTGRLGAYTFGNVTIGSGTIVHPTARIVATVRYFFPMIIYRANARGRFRRIHLFIHLYDE